MVFQATDRSFTVENDTMTLQLASKSPRRAELLHQIGVKFVVVQGSIDETRESSENVHQYVARLATEKAKTGYKCSPYAPTLGADTVVQCQNQILGKPKDQADAEWMLNLMSGQWHQVATAVAVYDGEMLKSATVVSEVKFRDLTTAEIEAYWSSGEPADKAGAYGIQGKGGVFVEQLRGDYSAVVGLPLCETAKLLSQFSLPVWLD